MKKLFFLLMAFPLCTLSQNKKVVSSSRNVPKEDKIQSFEKALAAHAQKYRNGDVHWRVLPAESAPEAGGNMVVEGNVKWEEFKTHYTASFVHSGIRSKINYNKNGDMTGSIRYYEPQTLPLNLYNKLKREHSKKEMYGVIEVTSGSDIVYFVKMQDANNWFTIKIDASGNSFIHEKYKKV